MPDIIERAKNQVSNYIKKQYADNKFTLKFNGEFLIAISQSEGLQEIKLSDLPTILSSYKHDDNKVLFTFSNNWIKDSIQSINSVDASTEDLTVYSQIMRLGKQIEFNLTGGKWSEEMYAMATNILYFLHTKSNSIRANTVKMVAMQYNKLQIKGQIPYELIVGYRNALTIISSKQGAIL